MKKILFLLLFAIAILASSCSKTDEVAEPAAPRATTWVNYAHTVSSADETIPYDIEYLTASGLQTVINHTGNFSVRVPAMKFDSAGTTYVRTLLTIRTSRSDAGAPVINSAMKISTDNGLVIAETSKSAGGCGYTERTLSEVRPLRWFTIQ